MLTHLLSPKCKNCADLDGLQYNASKKQVSTRLKVKCGCVPAACCVAQPVW